MICLTEHTDGSQRGLAVIQLAALLHVNIVKLSINELLDVINKNQLLCLCKTPTISPLTDLKSESFTGSLGELFPPDAILIALGKQR